MQLLLADQVSLAHAAIQAAAQSGVSPVVALINFIQELRQSQTKPYSPDALRVLDVVSGLDKYLKQTHPHLTGHAREQVMLKTLSKELSPETVSLLSDHNRLELNTSLLFLNSSHRQERLKHLLETDSQAPKDTTPSLSG